MVHLSRGLLALASSAAILTLVACDAPGVSPPDPRLIPDLPLAARSSQTLPRVTLTLGDTTNFVAISQLAQYAVRESVHMQWATTAPSVLRVNGQGIGSALAVGSGYATVAVRRWVDTIPVTVVNAQIASVSVSINNSSIPVGQTASLTAVARDNRGAVIPGVAFAFSSSNTSVATVSSNGTVTGQSAGSATLSASAGGTSGSVSVTVTGGSPPPPPPPSGNVPLPILPNVPSFTYPRVTGRTIYVNAGDNLQTALNAAQRGDELVLAANATFTGNFTLNAKPGNASNGWILIRSDKDKQLPPQGTRVQPKDVPHMPLLISPNVTGTLMTAPGASGWWISGLEVTVTPSLPSQYINYGLVLMGDGTSRQSSLSQVPQDIVLDRMYIHGHSNVATMRCVGLNSGRTAILDSYLQDCHAKGFDSQAIAGWNGPGPYKIINNTLAGAGENIMFGGADPSIPGLVTSDVEIRRNYVYTPASWKGKWTKKNLFETKNAKRVLIEGNVFDGSWADGQVGYAFLLKVSNQSGGCPQCATTDITIRSNIIRNAGAGFDLLGREGNSSHPIGQRLTRVLIENNIVENIDVGIYQGDSKLIQILNNAQDLTIRSNTMTAHASVMEFMVIGPANSGTNLDFQNNIVEHGNYGMFSSWFGMGQPALRGIAGTVIFNGIVIIGPQKPNYPNASFVSSLSQAQSTGKGANTASVLAATQGVIIP